MIQFFPGYCVSVHVLLCHSIYATGLPFSLPIPRITRISSTLRSPLHSFHPLSSACALNALHPHGFFLNPVMKSHLTLDTVSSYPYLANLFIPGYVNGNAFPQQSCSLYPCISPIPPLQAVKLTYEYSVQKVPSSGPAEEIFLSHSLLMLSVM
jgi:hypothetical protein